MHDIRFIRENPDVFDAGLKRRGMAPQAAGILALDGERRTTQTEMQELQAERNNLSKQVGDAKRNGGDTDTLMQQVAVIKERLASLEDMEKLYGKRLTELLATLPNLPASDVPDGKDESDNKELRRFGQPRLINNPMQHFELGEALGQMDFERATKLSGARFSILQGQLARLERALGNFMLDLHTQEFGYTEVSPPLLVKDEIMFGTAQLPKFMDDQFIASRTKSREELLGEALAHADANDLAAFQNGTITLADVVANALSNAPTKEDLWLIPTAEVPLTNMVNNEILDRSQLPMRLTARTPCFRAEAGAAGRDTRGMLRQHQFYKVEMVSITTPDQSEAEHERMVTCAETVLQRLELPYRTIVLCTGDMGFASRKTYDIEVWVPGQNTHREISSCSNCGDFQARRMNARTRIAGDKQTEFVHTLNGSGVAIGRCLIAVMENYQQPDGTITIPTVLRDYMGGLERIG